MTIKVDYKEKDKIKDRQRYPPENATPKLTRLCERKSGMEAGWGRYTTYSVVLAVETGGEDGAKTIRYLLWMFAEAANFKALLDGWGGGAIPKWV